MKLIRKIKFYIKIGIIGCIITGCYGINDYFNKPDKATVAETSQVEVVEVTEDNIQSNGSYSEVSFNYDEIPLFDGTSAVYAVNNNIPYFNVSDYGYESFESYSELDSLGRCGECIACIGYDLMPTEERGEIGEIKPSGWHTAKYSDVIEDNYLYNRCHLIGFQLTGENANPNNLVTGTRFMNVDGMLSYENIVAYYIYDNKDNHVLYRATPIFINDELVCRGILLEAYSLEDNGSGVCFNVFCYNVQPGISIDYTTGDNEYTGDFLEIARSLGKYETVH